jgi:hypothetical protein
MKSASRIAIATNAKGWKSLQGFGAHDESQETKAAAAGLPEM